MDGRRGDTEACSRPKTFAGFRVNVSVASAKQEFSDSPRAPFTFLAQKMRQTDGMRRGKRSLRDTRADYSQTRGSFYIIYRKIGIDCQRAAGRGMSNLPKILASSYDHVRGFTTIAQLFSVYPPHPLQLPLHPLEGLSSCSFCRRGTFKPQNGQQKFAERSPAGTPDAIYRR